MQNLAGKLTYSPTDLIKFLESPFSSWMDRCYLEHPEGMKPDEDSEERRLIAQTGDRHEKKFLKALQEKGPVTIISRSELAVSQTIEAIRRARLSLGRWPRARFPCARRSKRKSCRGWPAVPPLAVVAAVVGQHQGLLPWLAGVSWAPLGVCHRTSSRQAEALPERASPAAIVSRAVPAPEVHAPAFRPAARCRGLFGRRVLHQVVGRGRKRGVPGGQQCENHQPRTHRLFLPVGRDITSRRGEPCGSRSMAQPVVDICQSGGGIDDSGGFADASFLVEDRNFSHFGFSCFTSIIFLRTPSRTPLTNEGDLSVPNFLQSIASLIVTLGGMSGQTFRW